MTKELFHEIKGKTSIGGKIVRLLFWVWQIVMICWLFSYWGDIGKELHQDNAAAQAGAEIGSAIGTGLLVFFWIGGTVILGIPMLMTRPQKYLVKAEDGAKPVIK